MTIDEDNMDQELHEWRTRLDELRVRGNLLKMELRDRKDEVVADMEKSYGEAKSRFDRMKNAADSEREKLVSGFEAAWKAFKQSYKDATE